MNHKSQCWTSRPAPFGRDADLLCVLPFSRFGSSSSTEPLTASRCSLERDDSAGGSLYRRDFFSQLSGQTFYNNEYGHLSEEGFCDFFASPDGPCLASSNV